MAEHRTVVSCAQQLEVALRCCERDLVHFLLQKGFITEEVHDEILNPRSMLTAHQKAGELVTGIRNKVELSAQSYHTLLEHLRQGGELYEEIVKILEEEYSRQLAGVVLAPTLSLPLQRYSRYLKSCYNNTLPSDDKLLISPCDHFIQLALVEKREQKHAIGDKFSRSTFYGGVDEIVACKSPLELDALLVPGIHLVLVEGLPGIGKSTLCLELCRKWDTLKSLQCFKIVLLLKLREKRVQNASELNEIFVHRDKKLCQSVVDEVFECEGEGVLLILDGLDEMPTSLLKDKSTLIIELLSGMCLPKAVRLVTSRPCASHHKEKVFKQIPRHVEILGFTDEYKIEFAENAFKSEPEVLCHFKDFLFSNPIINSLMYIPINCAIIAQVFKEMRTSQFVIPKTMTQLYTTLVLVLIRRHMIERGKWDEDTCVPTDLTGLSEDVLTALRKIGELAYYKGGIPTVMYFGTGSRLSSVKVPYVNNHIQVVFTDEDVGMGFQHLGLLSEARDMYVSEGTKSSYSFLHLSIQEFLAAWHLSCNRHLVKDGFFSMVQSMCSFSAFGKFATGLLKCAHITPNTFTNSSSLAVQYLYEAQNSCKSLNSYSFPKPIVYHSLSPLDLYAFGYVLVHASIQWELHLQDYSDMSHLVNSLASSLKIQGRITKLEIRRQSKVEELPASLLRQITELDIQFPAFGDPPISWLSQLHNLQALSLEDTCHPKDASLLYEAIRSFSNLKRFCFSFQHDLAIKDLGELCQCLATSQTLEYVKVVKWYPDGNKELVNEIRELRRLVETALTCSTLKNLFTCIPFVCTTLPCKLESLSYSYPSLNSPVWSPEVILGCFESIAEICRAPTMRSLELVHCGSDYRAFNKFLAALNHSLHSNPCFAELKFDLQLPKDYCVVPHSIRPNLLSWNRSKSLSDLATPVYVNPVHNAGIRRGDAVYWDRHGNVHKWEDREKNAFLVRSDSCPALFWEQSSLSMHHLLSKALHSDKLKYPKKRWDMYRIVRFS